MLEPFAGLGSAAPIALAAAFGVTTANAGLECSA
jgi:hypothetical protein